MIRKNPQPEAEILESRHKGDTLRISSASREGWYKTRTSQGAIGWVRQDEVTPETTKKAYGYGNLDVVERQESKRSTGEWKLFLLKAGAGPFFHMPGDLNSALGRPAYKAHRGQFYFGSFAYSIMRDLALGIRVEHYNAHSRILSYDIETSSTPLLVGAEYTFHRTPRWRFSFQLYGGIGIGHQSTIIAADQPDNPNKATLSGTPTTALLTVNATYRLWSWLGIFGELGGRYSSALATSAVSNEFNGQTPFFMQGSGVRAQFRVSDTGPHAALGIEASF